MKDNSINNDVDEKTALNNKDLVENEKPNEAKNFEVDPNDIDKFFSSNMSIIKKNISITIEFVIVISAVIGRDLIVFGFCRDKGFSITEALTAFTLINELFGGCVPYALTANYMYKSGEAYAAGNAKLFGELYNKTNFILLVVGSIMLILFCTAFPAVFGAISNNAEAVSHLTAMLRWMSIGIIFWFLQFVSMRYIGNINSLVLTFSSFLAIAIQVAWSFIFIFWLDLVDFGAGMSLAIGFIVNFVFQFVYIQFWKPYPEAIIGIFDGIFTDFWAYFWDSIKIGFTIFLTYFSIDFIPYFGLIISDADYAVLNMMSILLLAFTMFTEGLNIGNNVLIAYCIGKQQYSNIRRVLTLTAIITTIYVVVVGGLCLGLFQYVVLLFTSEEYLIELATTQRVYFFFTMSTAAFHNLLSETILQCGGDTWGLISTIIGRFAINIILGLILIFRGFGISSVLLGFLVGQSVTLLMNGGYLIWLFKNNNKNLNSNMLNTKLYYESLSAENEKQKAE